MYVGLLMCLRAKVWLSDVRRCVQVLDDFAYDPRTIGVRDREENIQKLQQRVKNVRSGCCCVDGQPDVANACVPVRSWRSR
jgi:hypothetical protein